MLSQIAPGREYWSGQHVLITGGTGFLGQHFTRVLTGLGASVVSASRSNGCDLRDPRQAQATLCAARPGVVIHLAANQGGVAYQRTCPGTILHDNVLMAVNTMEAARLAGVKRYVNLIAGCAYPGETPDGILREEDIDAGPLHPSADNYGISKRVALLQAKHYRAQFGMNVTSVVLANTYGPGDHFSTTRSHVVGALLRKFFEAVRTQAAEVVVWGRGVAERDLLYVDDAVVGTLLAVELEPETDLLNIATGIPVPVAEAARTIARVIGYRGEIVFDDSKPEGPLKKTLDTSRMKQLLGWEPHTPLENGLRKTLRWLDEHHAQAFTDD